MAINFKRFFKRLYDINNLKNTSFEKIDINRIALTLEDKIARDKIIKWMKNLNLTIKIDNIGNIFGFYNFNKNTKPLLLGSHIDTVRNAGRFDGSLGVIGALEVLETLIKKNVTNKPIGIAIFTNEEGVRFTPDMMGSWSFTKRENINKIYKIKDNNNINIKDALKKIKYLGKEKQLFFKPKMFLELHIEQGPILDIEKKNIGIVKGVQAITWLKVVLFGKSNHAGTTPMSNRRDPIKVFGEVSSYINSFKSDRNQQMITIGSLNIEPNQVNVIANKIEFTLDIRNPNDKKLVQFENNLNIKIKELCLANNIKYKIEKLVNFPSVKFDKKINKVIINKSKKLKYTYLELFSGAGHDAQMLANICPTSMIFVPSEKGISHDSKENTKKSDIKKGLNLLYNVTKELLKE